MGKRFIPLKLFPSKTSFDFMGKKWIWFSISFILVAVSLISLPVKGLNLGIDFSGGILMETRFSQPADIVKMRDLLGDLKLGEVSLQNFGSPNDVMIRIGKQTGGEAEQMKAVTAVKDVLAKEFGTVDYRKVDFVGPQVGEELIQKGVLALLLAFAAIMIYVWIRFEWQYGIGALVALLHDAVLTIGFYSITGMEFNLTSIAALLTIIGYSINDSVVIYDRIRENVRKYKKIPMDQLLNISINDTLSRTVLTVSTTLLSALALIFFGGEVIRSFSMAVFFGIAVGTYSSIYISAPLLIFLHLRPVAPEVAGNGQTRTS
jgi:preprotein translocase subunit SecF